MTGTVTDVAEGTAVNAEERGPTRPEKQKCLRFAAAREGSD